MAGGGRTVLRRGYGYDAADQITRVEDEARGARAYAYDAVERLLAVEGADPERFVVDPAGNLLAATDGAAPAPDAPGVDAPAIDAAPGDRLRRFRGRAGERTFAYDAWGNRVREERRAAPNGAVAEEVAYRYGADDVLREVGRARGRERRVTRFGYDALGRRVWKAARLTAAAALVTSAPSTIAAPPARRSRRRAARPGAKHPRPALPETPRRQGRSPARSRS